MGFSPGWIDFVFFFDIQNHIIFDLSNVIIHPRGVAGTSQRGAFGVESELVKRYGYFFTEGGDESMDDLPKWTQIYEDQKRECELRCKDFQRYALGDIQDEKLDLIYGYLRVADKRKDAAVAKIARCKASGIIPSIARFYARGIKPRRPWEGGKPKQILHFFDFQILLFASSTT